jgi:hypothetical protein
MRTEDKKRMHSLIKVSRSALRFAKDRQRWSCGIRLAWIQEDESQAAG